MAKPRPLSEQIESENKQINITPDDEKDLARIALFARRNSTEELIREIVTIDLIVANAQAERKILETELETRFNGKKAYELITSKHGVAERKVTNTYVVDPSRIDVLRQRLGAEFDDIISTKSVHKIAPSRVAELIERLGDDAEEFFTTKHEYKCTKLASTRIRQRDPKLKRKLGKAVNVVQKIDVKVRPLNEEAKR